MANKIKKTNIGKTIALLRKRSGYTQKSLADKLFISDKAVSKWERGLSYPDVTFLNKLSKIFDIDTDALFVEEDKSSVSNWTGILYFPSGVNNVKFSDKICDRYILEIMICYYLLVGISNILIICDGNNFRFAKSFVSKLRADEINVRVIKTNEFLKKKGMLINNKFTNIMLIYNLFFVYGVGLTSSFQRAMLDSTQTVTIGNPKIPIVFGPRKDIFTMIDNSNYVDNSRAINLFRGYLVQDLNSAGSIKKCAKLYQVIENVSGMTLYDINEIMTIRHL